MPALEDDPRMASTRYRVDMPKVPKVDGSAVPHHARSYYSAGEKDKTEWCWTGSPETADRVGSLVAPEITLFDHLRDHDPPYYQALLAARFGNGKLQVVVDQLRAAHLTGAVAGAPGGEGGDAEGSASGMIAGSGEGGTGGTVANESGSGAGVADGTKAVVDGNGLLMAAAQDRNLFDGVESGPSTGRQPSQDLSPNREAIYDAIAQRQTALEMSPMIASQAAAATAAQIMPTIQSEAESTRVKVRAEAESTRAEVRAEAQQSRSQM